MHLRQQYTISPRFEGGSEMEWKETKKMLNSSSSKIRGTRTQDSEKSRQRDHSHPREGPGGDRFNLKSVGRR